MAIAKVMLTCSTCGEQFERRRERANRAEADAYIEWALENIKECPSCWRKQRDAADTNRPAILPAGARWNGTIYQYGKRMAVYLDGVKTEITAEQAAELEAYKKGEKL